MPDASSSPVAAVVVRVVYLARLRDALESSGEALAVPGPAPTVAVLLDALRGRGGPWAAELAAGRAFRVAVNHDLVDDQATLRDGDEVALLPPVTGG